MQDAFEVADPQPDRDIGPVFLAAYDSDCQHCYERIEEGDHIRYVDNEVACEDCWPDGADDE